MKSSKSFKPLFKSTKTNGAESNDSALFLAKTMTNKNTQGVEAARAGDLLKAENLFKQAYKEDPTNQGIFQNIIRVMQMTGNIDGLLNYYEQIEKSNSQTIDRQIGQQIVELALRSGKNQMAQKILEKQVQKGDYSAEIVIP